MRSKHLLFQVSPQDAESKGMCTQTEVFVGFAGDVKGAASTDTSIILLWQPLLPLFEFFCVGRSAFSSWVEGWHGSRHGLFFFQGTNCSWFQKKILSYLLTGSVINTS